jgi:hypothetical protein
MEKAIEEENSFPSEVNMSLPYEHTQGNQHINYIVPQENENFKNRPISAAVIRSPNIRIKEVIKEKRDFKVANLDEERKENIPEIDYFVEQRPIIEEVKSEFTSRCIFN